MKQRMIVFSSIKETLEILGFETDKTHRGEESWLADYLLV